MLDKLDAALRFQQEALNLRAQRQEVLAANIANADTPCLLYTSLYSQHVVTRQRQDIGDKTLVTHHAGHAFANGRTYGGEFPCR